MADRWGSEWGLWDMPRGRNRAAFDGLTRVVSSSGKEEGQGESLFQTQMTPATSPLGRRGNGAGVSSRAERGEVTFKGFEEKLHF